MSGAEAKAFNFVENGYVKLATMAAIVFFCVGTVWKGSEFIKEDALWKQKISMEMAATTKDRERDQVLVLGLQTTVVALQKQVIELVSRTDERWKKGDMRGWVHETKKLNPDWNPASIDKFPN